MAVVEESPPWPPGSPRRSSWSRRTPGVESLRPLSEEESPEVAAHTVAEFLQRIDFRGELERYAREQAEPSVASLARWLRSKDLSTRVHAAKVLRKRKDPAAVGALIQALREDEHLQVRAIVAEALGKTADSRGVEPLIQAMMDEESSVRQMAAYALGILGDATALEALTKATEDESWFVRSAARSSIKRIGGK